MTHKLDINDNIIIGGDWNVIQNSQLDCKGGVEIKVHDRRKLLLNDLELIKETFQVRNIWRVKNPNCNSFTWRKKNPVVESRLDFWLLSKKLQDYVQEADIVQ